MLHAALNLFVIPSSSQSITRPLHLWKVCLHAIKMEESEWEFESSSEDWPVSHSLSPRPKRRRVSSQLPNQMDQQPNQHQTTNDQAKLASCPTMLRDLLINILLIDSLCGLFQSYGKAIGWGKGNFVEMFSGGPNGRAVSNGFRNKGWEGEDFDKSATEDHDFTSSFGFCATLLAIFRLGMGDPLWTGLVCTSFCWVNRCTSERGPSNNYLGNQSLKHVAIGNLILYRNMLLLLLHQAAGGIVMLEQPMGSCMPSVPLFRSVWKLLRWNYVVVWLGAYGAESKKPIKIFAPVDWIANLKNRLTNTGDLKRCARRLMASTLAKAKLSKVHNMIRNHLVKR